MTGRENHRRQRFAWTALAGWMIAAFAGTAWSQPGENPLPRLVSRDGRHALIVDGKPFVMLGAQCHNSSAWPAMLPAVLRITLVTR